MCLHMMLGKRILPDISLNMIIVFYQVGMVTKLPRILNLVYNLDTDLAQSDVRSLKEGPRLFCAALHPTICSCLDRMRLSQRTIIPVQ